MKVNKLILKSVTISKQLGCGLTYNLTRFIVLISFVAAFSACSNGKHKPRIKKDTAAAKAARLLKESELSKNGEEEDKDDKDKVVTDTTAGEKKLKPKPDATGGIEGAGAKASGSNGTVINGTSGTVITNTNPSGVVFNGSTAAPVKAEAPKTHTRFILSEDKNGVRSFKETVVAGSPTKETGGYIRAEGDAEGDKFIDLKPDKLIEAARQQIDSSNAFTEGASKDFAARIDQVYVYVNRKTGATLVDLVIHDGVDAQGHKKMLNLKLTGELKDGDHANLFLTEKINVGVGKMEVDPLEFMAKLACLDKEHTCENVMVKFMQLEKGAEVSDENDYLAIRTAYFIHRWGNAGAELIETGRGEVGSHPNKNFRNFGRYMYNTQDANCKPQPPGSCGDGDPNINLNVEGPRIAKELAMRTWAVVYGAARFHIIFIQRGGPEDEGTYVTANEMTAFVGTLKTLSPKSRGKTWYGEVGDKYLRPAPEGYGKAGAGSGITVGYSDTYASTIESVEIAQIEQEGEITLVLDFGGPSAPPFEMKFTDMINETRNIKGRITELFDFK